MEDLGNITKFDTCNIAAGPIPIFDSLEITLDTPATVADEDILLCGGNSIDTISNITTDPFDNSTKVNGNWYYVSGDGGMMNASVCSNNSSDVRVLVFDRACDNLTCIAGTFDECSVAWQSTFTNDYTLLVRKTMRISMGALFIDHQQLSNILTCRLFRCMRLEMTPGPLYSK